MAWRFQKRIKIAPGIRVNLSRSGISTTVGVKGASITTGKKGAYLNAGVPGTGLSTRTRLDGKRQRKAKGAEQKPATFGDTVIAIVFLALIFWGAWVIIT